MFRMAPEIIELIYPGNWQLLFDPKLVVIGSRKFLLVPPGSKKRVGHWHESLEVVI